MVRGVVALVLAGYGLYTAAYLPAMFIGPFEPLLVIGFLLQAVFAIAAALGVWLERAWAPFALVLLGISIAATQLVEAFVLGILPWLRALFVSIIAVAGALILAAYIARPQGTADRKL